jgi:methylmalonyl-CoA carboxyltransferase large subunit
MAADDIDLKALLERLEQLDARVRKLETDAPLRAAPAGRPAAGSASEQISEDMLAVLSAAIAAFLGVKAKIRQVRLVGSEAWAQQGRASVMASHQWSRRP